MHKIPESVELNIKVIFQEIDKLVDLYNSKEPEITSKDKADLKEVIFSLSEKLERKVPLTLEHKYIEILTKDPEVFNCMMMLSSGPNGNIPIRFFEQYLKIKYHNDKKLNNGNIIGFTDTPGFPYITAFVYPYRGRLYVDWGENIPKELERRYQGEESDEGADRREGIKKIRELYGNIEIPLNNIPRDFNDPENEVREERLM